MLVFEVYLVEEWGGDVFRLDFMTIYEGRDEPPLSCGAENTYLALLGSL
jgi:hypothetical protein